jgi:tetratricopeptide (TPR) repeat protein
MGDCHFQRPRSFRASPHPVIPRVYWNVVSPRLSLPRFVHTGKTGCGPARLAPRLPGLCSRGLTYLKQNEYAKALSDFDEGEKLGDGAWAYWGRGKTYEQQGKKEQAVAAFNQAIALSDNDITTKEEAQRELAILQGK